MLISVVNLTVLDDARISETIRAINRQISEDFAPYWGFSATLRLEGRPGKHPRPSAADMRGEAVLYVWDGVDADDALGYHDRNFKGIPFGIVFRELSEKLGESWTATFSHEALELLGDPEANLLVQGPDPRDHRRRVFHWFEMCDAVQDETYLIDGVEVSNFVLPLYFAESGESGTRTDFLGAKEGRPPLRAFGVAKGGYIGFYDPRLGRHTTWAPANDARAAQRMRIKAKAKLARRAKRYEHFTGNRDVRPGGTVASPRTRR